MVLQIDNVVERFVDLVLKRGQQGVVEEWLEEDIQVILEIVSDAGFDPKTILPGELVGYYLNPDGSRTGKTFPVNSFCMLKVVDSDGGNLSFATGWLDCAFKRVVSGSQKQGESREQLIKAIADEIKRSVPMEPIRLNLEGDILCEYPPVAKAFELEYFVKHTRDHSDLCGCVGIHKNCNSWMDRHQATDTHDAILCSGCGLQVLFPKEVKTFGDLREVSNRIKIPV